MRSTVNFETVGVRKPFATLPAFIRLLPTVDPHVGLEAIGLSEGRSALLTLEGSVTRVFPHVNRQLPRLRERGVAFCAPEWPLPGMLLFVCNEAVQATEIGTTLFANKRSIARVNAHVHFEAVRAGVPGEADATLVGFLTGVLALVLLQSVGDGETAATVLAYVRFVPSVGSTVNNQAACNTRKNV